jgi:hypothetical protein
MLENQAYENSLHPPTESGDDTYRGHRRDFNHRISGFHFFASDDITSTHLPHQCTNNLKQTGLAYKIWAGDNHDKYPMEISVTNGGAMELMTTPDAWKVFQVMSNELSTPKVIYCPEDSLHGSAATNWGDDLKNKISYFIGVDANDALPSAILSGDGNFLLNDAPANYGFVNVISNATLAWDTTRHGGETKQGWFTKVKTGTGNIGLADGSVQSLSQSGLTNQLHQTGFVTNRFFIP